MLLGLGLRGTPDISGHMEVRFFTGDTGETVLVVERVLVERQDVLPQVGVVGRVVIGLKGEVVRCHVLLDFLLLNYFRLLYVFLISRRYFFLKF